MYVCVCVPDLRYSSSSSSLTRGWYDLFSSSAVLISDGVLLAWSAVLISDGVLLAWSAVLISDGVLLAWSTVLFLYS